MIYSHDGNLLALCRHRGWHWNEVLDFSSNVNPLGFPPGVPGAIQEAMARIRLYPESDSPGLRSILAAQWRVPPEAILLGNGGTELLTFFARAAWTGPITLVTPASLGHLRSFPKAMKVPVTEPDRWPQRGLLVLTQPNQPTGEAIPLDLVKRAVAAREGPVLIDESYIEYSQLESAVTWTEHHPNLVVLRSLSPFYGLPGLRVGALIAGNEWMSRLMRQREPWQVNVLAEAAASKALQDVAFAEATRNLIDEERPWLEDHIGEWTGVEISNSVANYLFLTVPKPAIDVYNWFLDRKIFVRKYVALPGLPPQAIGITIRNRADNTRLIEAGRELFCGA